ncbi:putative adenosine deaminase-2 [Coleophoma crateriformis]|uniref:Putative adenosine deaminase-2 n=1 Tax=Coleophoma crateriformis TaxID=565419 RepID=A0A3D8S986_9HELO|nr:putative adenosine deaminase-2 [Coleophoma crateriformis]
MTSSDFLQRLPKIELHLHIEGTLTPSLRWRLAQKNNIKLAYDSEEALAASYKTMYNHRKKKDGDILDPNGTPIPVFLDMYYGGMECLITESDFYDLAMEYFTKAASMNVRYCEPFFDIQGHTRRGVPVDTVMSGLQRAREDAATKLNVKSNWTMCFLRDMSPESAMENYEAALPYRAVFHAIGLDSDEFDRPPSLFEDVFLRARKDGFKITSHCDVGQKDTHEHIHHVVTSMGGTGADRLDHGLNAAERPELIEAIKARDLGMTLCPHAYHRRLSTEWVFSNVRKLFDAGIKITVNSDDPTYMHNMWVTENLALVQEHCPFTEKEMVQLQRNAVSISWADDAFKETFRKELAALELS